MAGGIKTFGSKTDKALEILDRIKTPTDKAMGGNVNDIVADIERDKNAQLIGAMFASMVTADGKKGDFMALLQNVSNPKKNLIKLIQDSVDGIYSELSSEKGLKGHVINISKSLKSISENLVNYLSGMQSAESPKEETGGPKMTYNIVLDTTQAENFDKILKEITELQDDKIKNVERLFSVANSLTYIDMSKLNENFIQPMNALTQLKNKEIIESFNDMPDIVNELKQVFEILKDIKVESNIDKVFIPLNSFTEALIKYNSLDLESLKVLPEKLEAMMQLLDQNGNNGANLQNIIKQMNDIDFLDESITKTMSGLVETIAYLLIFSDVLDDSSTKEILASIDNFASIVDSMKTKMDFSQEDVDKVKAALSSMKDCASEMPTAAAEFDKAGGEVATSFKNYNDNIGEALKHAKDGSAKVSELVDTYKASTEELSKAQKYGGMVDFQEISLVLKDVGSTILLMGATLMIGGYIFAKNQDMIAGSIKFAVTLTAFLTMIMIPIVLMNYIYSKIGGSQQEMHDVIAYISAMAFVMIIGGLVYKIAGSDLSKNAIMFAIDLTKFLVLLSIPIVIMGLLVKKGSLSNADKVGDLVIKCALVMVIGAIVAKNTDLMKSALQFGIYLSLFLALVLLPVAIFGDLITGEFGDTIDAIGSFVVKCALVMIIGALVVANTRLVKSALLFGVVLMAFIAMTLLPIFVFESIIESDHTAELIDSLTKMVISFSLVLMVGGLFMLWGNGKYAAGAWEFAKLLAKFTAMMLLVVALTTMFCNPLAALAIHSFSSMITRFTLLLIVGALFMMIPGFADAAIKFALLLFVFTALMAITMVLISKFINKDSMLHVRMFGSMVWLLSLALVVGGLVVNLIGIKPILLFAVMVAVMAGVIVGFCWALSKISPEQLLKSAATVMIFSIAVGFLAGALLIVKYAMNGFEILDMVKLVICAGLIAVVFAIIGDPYVAALVALGAATSLLMAIALGAFAIALGIVHKIMSGKEFGDLFAEIRDLGLLVIECGVLFASIGLLSPLVILASVATGFMSVALVMFAAAMEIISLITIHLDDYLEGIESISKCIEKLSLMFSWIGLLSPLIALASIAIGMMSLALDAFAVSLLIIDVVLGENGINRTKKNINATIDLIDSLSGLFSGIGLLSPIIALGSIAIDLLSVALSLFAGAMHIVDVVIGSRIKHIKEKVLPDLNEAILLLSEVFASIGLMLPLIVLANPAVLLMSVALVAFSGALWVVDELIGSRIENIKEALPDLNTVILLLSEVFANIGLLFIPITLGSVVITMLSGALILLDVALLGVAKVINTFNSIGPNDIETFGTNLKNFFDKLKGDDVLPSIKDMFAIMFKVAMINATMLPLIGMVSLIGTTVKDFANLTIPIDWNNEGKATRYRQLNIGDFKAVGENVNIIVTTMMETLDDVYTKHKDEIDELSEFMTISLFKRPKSRLLATIVAANMIGRCVGTLATSLANIAKLMIPDEWTDDGKPKHFIQMGPEHFKNAAEGIKTIIMTVGNALIEFADAHPDWIEDFMKGDGGWFSSGSKFGAVMKMSMGMGDMISKIAQGIKDYADLKIPTDWNADGSAKAYEHLTPQHFKDAATNIQTIMEEFGKAIAAGYDGGFSKALKKESNLETMSTAITNATTLLSNVAKSLKDIYELKFDNGDGTFTKLSYEIISNAATHIQDIMQLIPLAIIEASKLFDEDQLEVIDNVMSHMKPMGEFISSIVESIQNYANLRIPTKYNSDGKAIDFRPIDLTESLEQMTTNLTTIITGMGESLSKAYHAFIENDETPEIVGKMITAIKPIGDVFSGLMNAVQAYADFKIPEYKGDKIVGYKTFDNGKATVLFDKMQENLVKILTGLSGCLLDPTVQSLLLQLMQDKQLDNFKSAIESINTILGGVLETVKNYSELKIPDGPLDKDGKAKKYFTITNFSADDLATKISSFLLIVPTAMDNALNDPKFAEIQANFDANKETKLKTLQSIYDESSKIMQTAYDIITKYAELKIPKEFNKDGSIKSYVQMTSTGISDMRQCIIDIITAVPSALSATYDMLGEIDETKISQIKTILVTTSYDIMLGVSRLINEYDKIKETIQNVNIKRTIGAFINNVAEMYLNLATLFKDSTIAPDDIENTYKYIDKILSAESIDAFVRLTDYFGKFNKAFETLKGSMSSFGDEENEFDTIKKKVGYATQAMTSFLNSINSLGADTENEPSSLLDKLPKFGKNDSSDEIIRKISTFSTVAIMFNSAMGIMSMAINTLNNIPEPSVSSIDKLFTYINQHTSDINTTKILKIKGESEALAKYVKVINSINTSKVNSLIKLFEAMESWSNSIGDLDKFVTALSEQLSTTIDKLSSDVTEAKAIIDRAESNREERQKKLNESIEKIEKLMNKTLNVNVSQNKGKTISSAWEKPKD